MRRKEVKLSLTPITEDTFNRQGWKRHDASDAIFHDEIDSDEPSTAYYYTLSLPKDRDDDGYTLKLVSNATDELGYLKDIGISPGNFFVEILGTDGLGMCVSEEELEVLYKVLTGESIES
jgi:hypothetical protein